MVLSISLSAKKQETERSLYKKSVLANFMKYFETSETVLGFFLFSPPPIFLKNFCEHIKIKKTWNEIRNLYFYIYSQDDSLEFRYKLCSRYF